MREIIPLARTVARSPAMYTYLLAGFYVHAMKSFGLQARPECVLNNKNDGDCRAAFPSGHAVWGAMALILPYLRVNADKRLVKLGMSLSMATCLLRIIAKKHWLQNVLAGIAVLLRASQTVSFLNQDRLVGLDPVVRNDYEGATVFFELSALMMSVTSHNDSPYNRLGPWLFFAVINGINCSAKNVGTLPGVIPEGYGRYTVMAPVYQMATDPMAVLKKRPWHAAAACMALLWLGLNIAAVGNYCRDWHVPFTLVGGSEPEVSLLYRRISQPVAKAADLLSYLTGMAANILALVLLFQHCQAESLAMPEVAMQPRI